MSDDKFTPDWSKDWQALQRQYWNAWTDLTRAQGAETPDASTPWHEGLEQWSRMFGSAGKQSDATERLMSSAKNYLSLIQSMLSFAAGKDAGALNTTAWLDAMRGGMGMPGFDPGAFGKMPGFDPSMFGKIPGFDSSMLGKIPGFDPSMFGKIPGFDPSAFGKMPGFDASMLDNPMAKALREISGQGVKGFQQLAEGAAPMLQHLQAEGLSWLKAPAFGYMREHQEHYQKMALAFVDYQEANKKYNALIMQSSQRSFEILESKLGERSEPGRQIDSVRALYDLWVDAAEEAYAEIALSDEFREVYGEVVNSQMRVRSQMQQEVERISVDLGMPTRTELNSVHKRVHDLRRELRNGREAQPAEADDGRDAEIAAMRAEIDDLRRLLQNFAPVSERGRAPAAAPLKRAAAKSASRPGTRHAAPKRLAAKRTHVAAKSAVPVGKSAPDTAEPPHAPAAVAKGDKSRPKHAGKRRKTRRARKSLQTVPVTQKTPRSEKTETGAASFSDAIAAMRQQMLPKSGKKKKAKASVLSMPSKASSRLTRPGRSRP